jgi:uncharacterized protein (DUF924 family)
MIVPEDILKFWFSEPMSKHWFSATAEIDQHIRDQYEELWQQAAVGALDEWKSTPEGCLALCIVLDQFPLNMYREDGRRYSTEQMAVEVCLYAVMKSFDQQLTDTQKAFLYMPLMHSESIEHQDTSVALFDAAGLEENLKFAEHHREIVQRFGRFPHRNQALGRESTQEEIEWLASDEGYSA